MRAIFSYLNCVDWKCIFDIRCLYCAFASQIWWSKCVQKCTKTEKFLFIFNGHWALPKAKAITAPAWTLLESSETPNLNCIFFFISVFLHVFWKTRETIYRCCRSSFMFMIISHVYNISSVLYKSVSWNMLCFLSFSWSWIKCLMDLALYCLHAFLWFKDEVFAVINA